MSEVHAVIQEGYHLPHVSPSGVSPGWRIAVLRRALRVSPGAESDWEKLGDALLDTGRPAEAEHAYRCALKLAPDHPPLYAGLAAALRLQAYCIEALEACREGLSRSPGNPLLLEALAASLRGAGLHAQADRIAGEPGTKRAASLPEPAHTHGLRLESTAAGSVADLLRLVPDTQAGNPSAVPQLLQFGRALKIGLVWANAGPPASSLLTTVPLAEFAPLAEIPAVFILLQQGEAAREAAHLPEGMDGLLLPDGVFAPAGLAAVLRQIDLLITTDDAMARVSAACGCRTWMVTAADAAPFPQSEARVFRQARRGSWAGVMQELAKALRAWIEEEADEDRLEDTDKLLLAALRACDQLHYPQAERIYRSLLSMSGPHVARALRGARSYMERSRRFEFADTIRPAEGSGADLLARYSDLVAWSLARRNRHQEAFRIWDGLCAMAVPPLDILLHHGEEAQRTGDTARAVAAWELAMNLYPDAPMVPGRAAASHKSRDDDAKALDFLRRAAAVSPWNCTTQLELGILYRERGDRKAAARHFQLATYLNPDHAHAWVCLGHVLYLDARYHAAMACFEHANDLEPSHFASAHLGYSAYQCEKFELAHASLSQALRHSGTDWEALFFDALVLIQLQRYEEAIAALEAVREGDADYFARRHGRQHLFVQYLRRPTPERIAAARDIFWATRAANGERWHGQALDGKTLLVFQEAGFGDSLQGLRFLRMIRQEYRPARIILAVWPELARLYQGFPDVDEVHAIFSIELSEIACDFNVDDYTMMLICGGAPSGASAPVPYLKPDAALTDKWKLRLSHDRRFRVGLAWQGNPKHANDKRRSISLNDLLPLADSPNTSFYALQKGGPVAQAFDTDGIELAVPDVELTDFAETAALIAALDLVITIDSSPAHLAGALGVPVWVMLPSSGSDWRWSREGDTSAWYPQMRVFRQSRGESWKDVVRRVAGVLRAHVPLVVRAAGAAAADSAPAATA